MSQEDPEAACTGLGYSTTSAVRDILRECLAYHEQQERIRKGFSIPEKSETPLFVPSLNTTNSSDGALGIPDAEAAVSQSSASNEELQRRIDVARERARAVLQGFQKPSASLIPKLETINFAEQRQKGFQREAERKQQALLRNWDYLMDRQNRRAAQLSEQVTSSHAAAVEQQYNAVLQKRIDLLHRGATSHPPRSRKTAPSNPGTSNSIAVYWSTAPPHVTLEEADVRQLFGPYGTVHKIVQYRNKETGLLKGDGLVIYRCNEGEMSPQPRDLIQLVCGQMNGAELPNGSILHVEPAVSNNCSGQNPSVVPDSSVSNEIPVERDESNAPTPAPNGITDDPNESDDLDEFFESL